MAVVDTCNSIVDWMDCGDFHIIPPMPMMGGKHSEPTKIIEENTYTTVHSAMTRMSLPVGSNSFSFQTALVDSDTYREWMTELGPTPNGIPPHIGFGGAVVSGKRDPTFKTRWEERTIIALLEGRIQ